MTGELAPLPTHQEAANARPGWLNRHGHLASERGLVGRIEPQVPPGPYSSVRLAREAMAFLA